MAEECRGMSSQHWLVTGGLGFIGSAFVRLALRERPELRVTVLDAMTYAGNPANLAEIEVDPRYRFVKGNICDRAAVEDAIGTGVDARSTFAVRRVQGRRRSASARLPHDLRRTGHDHARFEYLWALSIS
jgi:nucleoside-diphosphate-sugar epimerase